MLTTPDFSKKQIIFVLFNQGEKIAFKNDNMIIKDANGKIKFQCTCYRIFIIFAIGDTSITTVLIKKAQKFGFFIALMTRGFRFYSLIGAIKDGNTLLRKKQYLYEGNDIAKIIIKNKIDNQLIQLKMIRNKNEFVKEAIISLKNYTEKISEIENLKELMAYEGLAAKLYFKNYFNNVIWKGRQPRAKRDYVNSALDIGYTLLFAFIDALLSSYGFDTYCGVLHKAFYMRKSLVCDLVEPFRPLIDAKLKKAINLKQIKPEDFVLINNEYRLKWEKSPEYVKIFMEPLLENKENIFVYIQSYYRAFMKGLKTEQYPYFSIGEQL